MVGSQYKSNQLIDNTRTYTYDPRYRLVNATGRKHATVTDKSTNVVVPSPDDNDYDPYDIDYTYDPVGNLTKNEEYSPGSLHYKAGRVDLFNGDTTEAGSFTDPALGNFTYDANGNTLSTPRQHEMAYTFDNQPRYVDMNGGGEVRYLRHADQRVVRLVKKSNVFGLTLYLGPFELHKRIGTGGADSYTKLVLYVSGEQRLAQVEKVLAGSDSTSLPVFFVHADHLGSGHVLTKADGTLLSQEEYFPYGRASDRRDARNRYRYIGVERDDDTGLCMTGPRTYDAVCGRFLQADALAGTSSFESPYSYAGGNPARRLDPGGYQDSEAESPRPPDELKIGEKREVWSADTDQPSNAVVGVRVADSDQQYMVSIEVAPPEYVVLGVDPSTLPEGHDATTTNTTLSVNISTRDRTIRVYGEPRITTRIAAGVNVNSPISPSYGTGATLGQHELTHAESYRNTYSADAIAGLFTSGWGVRSPFSGESEWIGGPVVLPADIDDMDETELRSLAQGIQGYILAAQAASNGVSTHGPSAPDYRFGPVRPSPIFPPGQQP